MTPDLRARFEALGVHVDGSLLASYPHHQWDLAVSMAVREFYPGMSVPEGYHQLGCDFVAGFQQTLIGKAVAQVARLIGVERTMLQMPQTQRLGNNYIDATAERVSPGHIRIRFELEPELAAQVHPPPDRGAEEFPRGVYLEVLRVLGARNPSVVASVRNFDKLAVDFDVRWTP